MTTNELWETLGDVAIDENDCTLTDFHIWPKGTDKMEIWHWFDKTTNGQLPPRGELYNYLTH